MRSATAICVCKFACVLCLSLFPQRLRAHVRQTRTELQLAAAINALQLDNQMLDTLHPVVLSTADSTVNR